MRREMHPELAVAVGRHIEAAHTDALDAGLVGFDQNRVRLARDAQQLERQRRHGDVLRLHDQGTRRTMPSCSVLMVSTPKPAAACSGCGCCATGRETGQSSDCGSPPSIASAVTGNEVSRPGTRRQAGFAKHDARLLDRFGDNLVVARQPRNLSRVTSSRSRTVAATIPGDMRSGSRKRISKPIATAPELGQLVDHVGDAGARPRPLAVFARDLLVEIDDPTGRAVNLRGSIAGRYRRCGPAALRSGADRLTQCSKADQQEQQSTRASRIVARTCLPAARPDSCLCPSSASMFRRSSRGCGDPVFAMRPASPRGHFTLAGFPLSRE